MHQNEIVQAPLPCRCEMRLCSGFGSLLWPCWNCAESFAVFGSAGSNVWCLHASACLYWPLQLRSRSSQWTHDAVMPRCIRISAPINSRDEILYNLECCCARSVTTRAFDALVFAIVHESPCCFRNSSSCSAPNVFVKGDWLEFHSAVMNEWESTSQGSRWETNHDEPRVIDELQSQWTLMDHSLFDQNQYPPIERLPRMCRLRKDRRCWLHHEIVTSLWSFLSPNISILVSKFHMTVQFHHHGSPVTIIHLHFISWAILRWMWLCDTRSVTSVDS